MFQRQRLSALPLCLAAVVTAGLALTLTGCGMAGGSAASTHAATVAAASQFGGNVHGGQQPVMGATVTLWAAGVTGASPAGYGANSTSIATTTTDSSGNFSFDNTSGVSPCTAGQYLYITSTGGDSGSGPNAQLALIGAIPTPCNSATGAQFVNVNELTTVATVTALQQFMSITPSGATPWKIGAPSTNLVGLANAFLTVGNLVNVATGATATSTTSNAITNTVGGVVYTTIVDPDYQKLNTLADILAACVNSAGGTTCTGLFTDVTPGSATAPTDTVQAMYYLATNPGGLTMPAHGNAVGSPSYLCTNYPTPTSPFQPTSTCTSLYDWTIAVKLKTTNPSAATVGTAYPASIGIDSQGNVWVGNGTGAAGSFIDQFNVLGALTILGPTTVNLPASTLSIVTGGSAGATTAYAYTGDTGLALTYGRPFSVAVDTSDNAFFSSFGPAITPSTAGTTTTIPVGLITEISSTGTVTPILSGSSSGALAIDGNNNIYLNNIPATGRYYLSELLSGNGYTTMNEGSGRLSSTLYNYVMVDGSASQYAIGFSSSTTCTNYLVQRVSTADEASQPTSPVTTANDLTLPSNCAALGAVDSANNIWSTYGGALNYINVAAGSGSAPITPVVTTVASSTNATTTATGGVAGVDNPAGVAIDGTGKVWTVNRTTSTFTGISELAVSTSGSTTTATALSPSGAGVFGFQSGAISGANGLAIDRSGNLWVMATSGSYLYYIVGAAAPVVTPMSVAIKNGTLGVRP